ncbi:uncharacterized protein LOC117641111 [Thrips palmi]|uniref:Uncharacterized protein LOC117641111 n=1 Tax=Thrips palmi TaxID=161013 RepID=A0A6P8YBG7_THRPL|nr:uncharacterized protein LOC117641111 [Thrips palmi]
MWLAFKTPGCGRHLGKCRDCHRSPREACQVEQAFTAVGAAPTGGPPRVARHTCQQSLSPGSAVQCSAGRALSSKVPGRNAGAAGTAARVATRVSVAFACVRVSVPSVRRKRPPIVDSGDVLPARTRRVQEAAWRLQPCNTKLDMDTQTLRRILDTSGALSSPAGFAASAKGRRQGRRRGRQRYLTMTVDLRWRPP